MTKLIVFDFDGVIITGSNDGYFRCYHAALESVGVRYDPTVEREKILARWGKGHREQIEYLLDGKLELLDKAVKAYEDTYYNTNLFIKDIKLVPGSQEALKQLSVAYKLAIATGMKQDTLSKLLAKFYLDMFDVVMSIDHVARNEDKKPSAFMVDEIRNKLRISKEETVLVGDGEVDVKMARNAGVRPIVVLTGHLNRKQAEELEVKDIIPDITSLKSVL